MRFIYN